MIGKAADTLQDAAVLAAAGAKAAYDAAGGAGGMFTDGSCSIEFYVHATPCLHVAPSNMRLTAVS